MVSDMGLRDDHRELTRRKVLDAVIDLVADGSIDELSIPAVARRSGVSSATIYRYFPTKDALLAAAADQPMRRALSADYSRDPTDDDLAAYQRAMWNDFAHNLPLLRHQLSSQAGREMRRARLARSRGQLAAYLEKAGIDPSSPEGDRLISMLLLVSGSAALVELHDRQGLAVDDALEVSLWAATVLIDATAEQPRTTVDAAARPNP
jgi:AcrR family transcriptional regulator